MNRSQQVDLGSGSVGRLLFSLAVPTITSQIVNMLYNIVDRVYIGHMAPVETVGKLALGGVGVCLPVIMIVSAFAALLAMGGAPRASIAEGRGDLAEAERIMGNCFTMLVAVGLVCAPISSMATVFCGKLGCDPDVYGTATSLTIPISIAVMLGMSLV